MSFHIKICIFHNYSICGGGQYRSATRRSGSTTGSIVGDIKHNLGRSSDCLTVLQVKGCEGRDPLGPHDSCAYDPA